MSLRPWTFALVLFAASCGGSEPVGDVKPDQPTNGGEEPPPLALSAEQLAAGSENIALVPSVVETQKALEAAGIETNLADLIATRQFDMGNEDKDRVAVRTGVVIADMLLTVKTAPKEKLLEHLGKIKSGIATLQGGDDIQKVISELEDGVRGGSITPDELLKQLDELSGAVIPELEFNGQERVVPLIQAGSWLEGANLVAKAVKQAGKPDAADAMLKQPAVVDYFIRYVTTEGKEKAGEAITQKLEESLNTLKGLAEKKEPFTAEDIDLVIKTTDDVLALL